VLAVLRFLLLPLKLGEAQIMIADPIPTLSGKSAQQTDVCFGPMLSKKSFVGELGGLSDAESSR
jgi:hypothetical protein